MTQNQATERAPSAPGMSNGKVFLLAAMLLCGAAILMTAFDRGGYLYYACYAVGAFGAWLLRAALRRAWRHRG